MLKENYIVELPEEIILAGTGKTITKKEALKNIKEHNEKKRDITSSCKRLVYQTERKEDC